MDKRAAGMGEKPAAVIFDMDGVIFDTENLRLNIMRSLAPKYGLGDVEPVYTSVTGMTEAATEQRYYERYGPTLPYAAIRAEARELEERHVKRIGPPVKPGVAELMDFLEGEGVLVGLASSGDMQNIRFLMERAGLISRFCAIVSGDSVKRGKPAPDIYLAAAGALNIDPARAWAVEDAYHGVEAAHAAGMRVAMVPDRLPPTKHTRALCALTVSSLIELKKAFAALWREG